jgi:hypothetical protein
MSAKCQKRTCSTPESIAKKMGAVNASAHLRVAL